MYTTNLISGFNAVFKQRFNVIGMLHVGGFPGSPNPKKFNKIIQHAQNEAKIYKRNRLHGVLIENLFDLPYRRPKDVTPEVVACMTSATIYIRRSIGVHIPTGIQILAGCNMEALAAAQASSCQFIRAEGVVYSHIADEGFIDACAGVLMRYKAQLNSTALVLADIKKKYCSHAITADVDITEMVHAAELAKVDAIILTGNRTGDPVNVDEFHRVRACTKLPVIIGSGVTIDNVADYIEANGVIVGSHFKLESDITNSVCPKRVQAFMEKVRELRGPDAELPIQPRRRRTKNNKVVPGSEDEDDGDAHEDEHLPEFDIDDEHFSEKKNQQHADSENSKVGER